MSNTNDNERPALPSRRGVRASILTGALALGLATVACGQAKNLDRIDAPAPAVETPKSPGLPADYPAPDVIARPAPTSAGLPADYPAPDVIARPAPTRAPVPGRAIVYRS
jgi:hypothetical protein